MYLHMFICPTTKPSLFPQHIISYPISPEVVNILFFDTSPGGLDKPLQGPSVVPSSKEKILDLYKDWEDDVRDVIEVRGFANDFDTSDTKVSYRRLTRHLDGL